VAFFLLLITHGTGQSPLIGFISLIKIQVKFIVKRILKYTPADYIDKRFCVNPEMMRQSRRLLTDAKSIEDINYDELTVEYKFDFIAPGDKVFFFKFFTFVPQKKKYKNMCCF
jgi:hypothetical protein